MHARAEKQEKNDAAKASPPPQQLTSPLAEPVTRLLGNADVRRLVQAKLLVGSPDDPFEREANRIEEEVSCGGCGGGPPCAKCASATRIARKTRSTATRGPERWIADSRLRSLGSGEPLDAATRATMQQRFGLDFGHVRIHSDSAASSLARELDARAFTAGSDIVFAQGEEHQSAEGQKLLTHELTHVVQQSGGEARVQRQDGAPAVAGEFDPCTVNLAPLTNTELLALWARVLVYLAARQRGQDDYFAYNHLRGRIVAERRRRVALGYAWLATEVTEVPDGLYELQPMPGLRIAVLPASRAVAGGAPRDLGGRIILTRAQFDAFLEARRIPQMDLQEYFRRQDPNAPPQPAFVEVPLSSLPRREAPVPILSGPSPSIDTRFMGAAAAPSPLLAPQAFEAYSAGRAWSTLRLGEYAGRGNIAGTPWATQFEQARAASPISQDADIARVIEMRRMFEPDFAPRIATAQPDSCLHQAQALERILQAQGIETRGTIGMSSPDAIASMQTARTVPPWPDHHGVLLADGRVADPLRGTVYRNVRDFRYSVVADIEQPLRWSGGGGRVPAPEGTAFSSQARRMAIGSFGTGAVMGGLMTAGHILYDPRAHPHYLRDLGLGTGLGGAGGVLAYGVESGTVSMLAPGASSISAAPLGARLAGGTFGGGIAAGVTTLAALGLDEAFFGGFHPFSDYAALGTRAMVSGAVAGIGGTAAAAGATTWLGAGGTGALAGSEFPIVGTAIGFVVGVGIYFAVDWAVGEDVEAAVREPLEEGCPRPRPQTAEDDPLRFCFTDDTPVSMHDGTQRPISSIVEGDELLSWDEVAHEIAVTRVAKIHVHAAAPHLVIRGRGIAPLEVTSEHPLFADGSWRRAGDLRAGMRLSILADDGSSVETAAVLSVEDAFTPATVRTLTVAPHHTFFAGSVLAHNKELL